MSNIFHGDNDKAIFVAKVYNLLRSREWITYTDAMYKYYEVKPNECPLSVSKTEKYSSLKKAFLEVRNAIIDKCGKDSIETKGNNRNKSFRYVGTDNDPLADMRDAKVVNDLKQYWQFCQESAGFFPMSWLEHFFHGYQDLLDIGRKRQKGEQVLATSLDRGYTGIERLPLLYEWIKGREVLEVRYKPYEEESMLLIFHPQYLKEYNGRWHLFGHAEGREPKWTFDIALDRIEEVRPYSGTAEYRRAPENFYKDYFHSRVGVSHKQDSVAKDIRLRAHTANMYKLTDTKPVHESQKIMVPFGEHEDGTYGDFMLTVEVNNEFIGRVMQMGAGLEIIAPEEIRREFAERVEKMYRLYN